MPLPFYLKLSWILIELNYSCSLSKKFKAQQSKRLLLLQKLQNWMEETCKPEIWKTWSRHKGDAANNSKKSQIKS